jgi:hypothetical protein
MCKTMPKKNNLVLTKHHVVYTNKSMGFYFKIETRTYSVLIGVYDSTAEGRGQNKVKRKSWRCSKLRSRRNSKAQLTLHTAECSLNPRESQIGCSEGDRAVEVHAYLFMSVPSSPPQIHAMIYGALDILVWSLDHYIHGVPSGRMVGRCFTFTASPRKIDVHSHMAVLVRTVEHSKVV